jgi:hypothetical protein
MPLPYSSSSMARSRTPVTHRQVKAMMGLDATQLQRGHPWPGQDERSSAECMATGFQLAGLDEHAHRSLRHLLAVPRTRPAGRRQVGAAQMAVLGDRAQHGQAVRRRPLTRSRLHLLDRRAQQAVNRIQGDFHHCTSASFRCSV